MIFETFFYLSEFLVVQIFNYVNFYLIYRKIVAKQENYGIFLYDINYYYNRNRVKIYFKKKFAKKNCLIFKEITGKKYNQKKINEQKTSDRNIYRIKCLSQKLFIEKK